MKEREYKFLLDEDTFDKTEQLLILQKHEMTERIQINYYYDTDQRLLLHNGITLRVRQIGGRLALQYKHRICDGSKFFVSEEKSISINHFNYEIILPFKINLKSKNGFINSYGGSYRLQGSLTTHRRIYNVKDGVKAVFDRNYYLGIFDCEIEIEFLKEKKEETDSLISELNLKEIYTSKAGKCERFYMRKEKSDIYQI